MKRTVMSLGVSLGLVMMVMACAGPDGRPMAPFPGSAVERLKSLPYRGTEFQQRLATEYQLLAESELEDKDRQDAEYFARKGLIAAEGYDVDPENPINRKIAKTMVPSLLESRRLLQDAVTEDRKQSNPEESARAIVMYDCWMEQQEEARDQDYIGYCREEFFAQLDLLLQTESTPDAPVKAEDAMEDAMAPAGAVGDAVVPDATTDVSAAPVVAPVSAAPLPVLYFDLNKAELNEESLKKIEEMVAALSAPAVSSILLQAHADRSSNPEYNLQLSKQRADAVRAELVKRGIPTEKIQVFAFGETDVVEETKDGYSHPKNRRVEVLVQ